MCNCTLTKAVHVWLFKNKKINHPNTWATTRSEEWILSQRSLTFGICVPNQGTPLWTPNWTSNLIMARMKTSEASSPSLTPTSYTAPSEPPPPTSYTAPVKAPPPLHTQLHLNPPPPLHTLLQLKPPPPPLHTQLHLKLLPHTHTSDTAPVKAPTPHTLHTLLQLKPSPLHTQLHLKLLPHTHTSDTAPAKAPPPPPHPQHPVTSYTAPFKSKTNEVKMVWKLWFNSTTNARSGLTRCNLPWGEPAVKVTKVTAQSEWAGSTSSHSHLKQIRFTERRRWEGKNSLIILS